MNTYHKLVKIIKAKQTAVPLTLNSKPTPGGQRIGVTPVALHWACNPVQTVCLSLDTDTIHKGLELLDKCAPYICMVKLHPELFIDWDTSTHPQLIKQWSIQYNILIMLDAKLVDVPEISYRFLMNSHYRANEWADMVTVMSVNYVTISDYLRTQGLLLVTIPVTEMNTGSPLFAQPEYQQFIKDSVLSYPSIIGIINQKTYSACCPEPSGERAFLKMTPGVVVYDSEITDNTHTSRYRTIKDAMFRDGNDIVIIGGSLINWSNKVNGLIDKAKDAASESMQYSKFANY